MITGQDVRTSMTASAERSHVLGRLQALQEIGLGDPSVAEFLREDARGWAMHLPLIATVADVINLIAAAEATALAAGFRLGRLHAGEVPSE